MDAGRMRICFDISAALGQGAGIGRYARQLALALKALPDGPALRLFHNRQSLDRLPPLLAQLPRSHAPLGNKVWRFYLLSGLPLPPSWRTAVDDSDLFHGADALAPRLRQPTLITIHDLTTRIFPQYHTRLNRFYLRWALPMMVARANAIIANSHATARDIMRHLGVAPDKITVVHLGVDTVHFAPQPPYPGNKDLEGLSIHPPYLLAVGTLEPRKNLLTLLRAYATLPHSVPPLVLVGGQGWGSNPLSRTIMELGLSQRVHQLGYVADVLLPALYSNADIFVYPSFYEGFGLPVLEAMACGAPVITSNVSSLPEVAGDAAVQVDPSRADDLAEAIRTLLESPDKCASLRQVGLERAQRFTWDKCAQETLDVYKRVLETIR